MFDIVKAKYQEASNCRTS